MKLVLYYSAQSILLTRKKQQVVERLNQENYVLKDATEISFVVFGCGTYEIFQATMASL